jgi:ATP-dependent DNA helicase RecG
VTKIQKIKYRATQAVQSWVELRIGGEEERSGELNGQINGQLNESQEDTLAFIRDYKGYNTTKIAEALNKPFRTIDKHTNALLKAGLIERRGSKKTGGYYPVGAEG